MLEGEEVSGEREGMQQCQLFKATVGLRKDFSFIYLPGVMLK